jgi:hypothetical protein
MDGDDSYTETTTLSVGLEITSTGAELMTTYSGEAVDAYGTVTTYGPYDYS